MYSLLLLSSLLHITTCTVYTVTPDDHYYPNTTCHHCHNLQHYLLNITKYFTSNTQLLFLPGLHHLHTDLIIQNVHNISLIGSTANGTTLDTVIHSNSSLICLTNISKLIIKNVVISCDIHVHHPPGWAPLIIKDCSFIYLCRLHILSNSSNLPLNNFFTLVAINVMGNSCFSHMKMSRYNKIQLLYNERHTNEYHHILSINNCTVRSLKLDMLQKSYKVTLKIINMQIQYNRYGFYFTYFDYDSLALIHVKELGTNEVIIINCQFISNIYETYLFTFTSSSNGNVQFIDCLFINNIHYIVSQTDILMEHALIKVNLSDKIEFKNCSFHGDDRYISQILKSYGSSTNSAIVIIEDTYFLYNTTDPFWFLNSLSLITLINTKLILKNSVIFNKIAKCLSIIFLIGNSTIIISGSAKFSYNHIRELIGFDGNNKYIVNEENSVIDFIHNEVSSLFNYFQHTKAKYPHLFCLFQYSDSSVHEIPMENRNFMIRFYKNQCKQVPHCYGHVPITNCLWLPQSLFNTVIPLEVNNKYIQFINNSGTYKLSQITEQSTLCVCTDEIHYDCHISKLGYLYPGQTLTISLYHHKIDAIVVKSDITQQGRREGGFLGFRKPPSSSVHNTKLHQ